MVREVTKFQWNQCFPRYPSCCLRSYGGGACAAPGSMPLVMRRCVVVPRQSIADGCLGGFDRGGVSLQPMPGEVSFRETIVSRRRRAMPRGSGSSGGSYSYREWAAAERAAQRERASSRTGEPKKTVWPLRRRNAMTRPRSRPMRSSGEFSQTGKPAAFFSHSGPRISFDSLMVAAAVPPLNLGRWRMLLPAPLWSDFEPKAPSGLGRMFGGSQRYQASYEAAEREFASAQVDHQQRESTRQRRAAKARAAWKRSATDAKQKADEHNRRVGNSRPVSVNTIGSR